MTYRSTIATRIVVRQAPVGANPDNVVRHVFGNISRIMEGKEVLQVVNEMDPLAHAAVTEAARL